MKQPRSPLLFRVLDHWNLLVLVLLSTLLAEFSFGQGIIEFETLSGGVHAPVTNFMTGERISGNDWVAQLYYGWPGIDESAMVTFADPPARFRSGEAAGYITPGSGGGSRYVNTAIVNPGVDTAFQIRVWAAVLGTSWEEAYQNWLSGSFVTAGLGKSSIIVTRTSATIMQPGTHLLGMQGFYVGVPVPEPCFGWLASLGLAAFFCRVWCARLRKH